MNDTVKVVAMDFTIVLVASALVYFTRRNQKRRFAVLFPVILIANVWLGFARGWRTLDFVQLGFFVLWGIVGCFVVFRTPAQRGPTACESTHRS
jgi:hypothetical protein